LPITDLTQFIANAGHHHLFFLDDGALVVTDLKGTQVAVLYGGEASAIATDGRTVYLVLGRGGQEAVAAISAATLAQTALYTLPQGDVPYSVAFQAGKIWVSYSGDNPVGGAIGYFKVGAAAFTPQALTSSGAGRTWCPGWPPTLRTMARSSP
jgi:hypothetical protein